MVARVQQGAAMAAASDQVICEMETILLTI